MGKRDTQKEILRTRERASERERKRRTREVNLKRQRQAEKEKEPENAVKNIDIILEYRCSIQHTTTYHYTTVIP